MSLPQIQSSDLDVTTSTIIPSFMDKLPLEVCQIIFEHSLSYPHLSSVLKNGEFSTLICEGESTTPRKFVSVFHSRTILCLVSRRWREWIYGTPTLWSTIIIYAHIPPSVENVKRWCLLSASCPLDIYADPLAPMPSTNELQELWDMPTPRYHHGFRELVDLFRINCFRIRRLVVTNWEEIQTPLSLIFPANSIACQLEVLVVLRYTQSGRDKSNTPIFDNVHAPNLHTLCMIPSLWSFASGWCPSLRSLSISAEGLRPASFQSLSSFSCLEYLEIHPGHPFLLWNLADWLHWHDSQTSLEIALPTLKHLSIACDPTGLTSMILKHMKSESLISVTYRGNDGEDNTLSALRDLPGINHVRYLKLEGLYFGKDMEVNIKKNFSSLNVIHLVESFVDRDFYSELMNMPHASPKKNTSEQSATPVFNDDEHAFYGKTKCIELEVEGITYYLAQQDIY